MLCQAAYESHTLDDRRILVRSSEISTCRESERFISFLFKIKKAFLADQKFIPLFLFRNVRAYKRNLNDFVYLRKTTRDPRASKELRP